MVRSENVDLLHKENKLLTLTKKFCEPQRLIVVLDGDRASVQEDEDDDEPDKNKNEEILEDP